MHGHEHMIVQPHTQQLVPQEAVLFCGSYLIVTAAAGPAHAVSHSAFL